MNRSRTRLGFGLLSGALLAAAAITLPAGGIAGAATAGSASTAVVVSHGTVTIPGTDVFNPVTGQLGGEVGIWWDIEGGCAAYNNRAMAPLGGDLLHNIGGVPFSSYGRAQLAALHYSNTPIPGSATSSCGSNLLVKGDVFAAKTAAKDYAKFLVLSYGYDLKVRWVTYS